MEHKKTVVGCLALIVLFLVSSSLFAQIKDKNYVHGIITEKKAIMINLGGRGEKG